jgi:hypothetical protein
MKAVFKTDVFSFVPPCISCSYGSYIASPAVATQETQESKNLSLIGTIVAGTPAIIQAIKQPTSFYKPPIAGTDAGGAAGAAQSEQEAATPTWVWFALGGAGLAALMAGFLAARR